MEIAVAAASPGTRVEVLRTSTGWAALRGEWDELFDASPTASPPLRWEWLRLWWRIYGGEYGGGGLRIFTVRREGRLLGVLPLYLRARRCHPLDQRCLCFLSTCEEEYEETCPDYLDLLHLPGEAETCLQALHPAIFASGTCDWDELDFRGLSPSSPLLAWREHGGGPADSPLATEFQSTCQADLSGGFDAFLDAMPQNRRKRTRRLLRSGEAEGVAFELAAGAEGADRFFQTMAALHERRWSEAGHQGCFAAPRFLEFHQALAREQVPSGRAVLAMLSHEGEAGAVLYGFIVRDRFYLYQMGVLRDRLGPVDSPGILGNLLLMKSLSERGFATYDFQRGAAVYKERLSTVREPLLRLRASRPTFRTAVHVGVRASRWLARKGRQLVVRTAPAPDPAAGQAA